MRNNSTALALALAFVSPTAFASLDVYDVKLELTVEGRRIAYPRVFVGGGDTAVVTRKLDGETRFIEIYAAEAGGDKADASGDKADTKTDSDDERIFMKITVGRIEKDGQRTIMAQPRIMTRENSLAKVSFGDAEGSGEEGSLAVIARKRDLLDGL